MAFRNNGNQGNGNNNGGRDDNWKSQGFINIYLTNVDGTRGRKIGAIPLKESKPFEAAMLKRLTEGGEEALQLMANKLELDFQRTDKEVKPTDLPF